MDLELQQHHAVITGGVSGIGYATACAFAREGSDVAIWDIADASACARAIADEFKVRTFGVAVDIADQHSVHQAMQRTRDEFPSVEHLVHAAAIGSGKYGFPFTNLQPSDWLRVLQINIMGMTHVAHAVTPIMQEQQSGTMVFLASVAGQIGSQTDPPYSASKAANINFAQCLAKDLAPYGVRVNTVCPGMVATPLNRSVWQAWHDQAPAAEQLSYEVWAERKIRAVCPLGRWQTPEAIADMNVFLSSARSQSVTGQTINVDGGFVMHW